MSHQSSCICDYEAEETRRKDALPAAKARLLAELKRSRVATVTITYDGEGDSGQIAAISGLTATGRPVKLTRRVAHGADGAGPVSLQQAVDDFAWEILGVYHGNFYDNEGGFGTIVIDVAAATVTIDHNDRIVDVCRTETEL